MSSECSVCGCLRSPHIRVKVETIKVIFQRENGEIRKAIDEVGDVIHEESMALKLLQRRSNLTRKRWRSL